MISAKIMGYTPKRKLLKEDAVPTIFDDSKPRKIRESSSKRSQKKEKEEVMPYFPKLFTQLPEVCLKYSR
jgi:hypothetical protein